MAHEVETMFYAGRTPWHELGQYVGEENLTSSEAIVAAGLDWRVEKHPLFIHDHRGSDTVDGGYRKIEDRVALVRDSDGEYFGTASSDFGVVQNHEAFSFMDGLVHQGQMKYHTAGSLRGGRRIWILGQIDGSFEPVKGDQVDPFIFLINGHDGSMALRAMPTAVRVVCANTARAAIDTDGAKGVSIRHTSSIHNRMHLAANVLANAHTEILEYQNFMKQLAAYKFDSELVANFVKSLIPNGVDAQGFTRMTPTPLVTSQREKLEQLFDGGVGQDIVGVHGTGWGMYNALTEFSNYHYGRIAQDRRFESVMTGNDDLISKGTKLLAQMTA